MVSARLTLRFFAVFAFASLALSGCTSSAPTETSVPPGAPTQNRSAGAFADTDPWILKTTERDAARGKQGIFLGNGRLGVTVGGNGAPHNALFIAGVYGGGAGEDYTNFGEYLSFPFPDPAADGYEQTLDMKRGVLTTKTPGAVYTVFALSEEPRLLVVHEEYKSGAVTPNSPDVKQTGSAHLAHWSVKEAEGGVTDYVAALRPERGEMTRPKLTEGYALLRAKHEALWAKRWADADIQIEGDPEAQQLIHKLMFDLLQSAQAGGDDSIAPESLSGDFYKGHIFWDAEIWMFPALLAQYPDLARTILEYRFRHLPQARESAQKQGYSGADFPWESAASGREVAPGGFSQGRHVTAGVGWAVWQYWLATGDKKWLAERGWPLLSGVADYFASRAKKNAAASEYEILRVFGPDENKGECDNNAYTNAMAKNVLNYATTAAQIVGKSANPQWKMVADKLKLPFDKVNNRYLARDGDKGEKTKQADGELLLWPAKLPMDAKTAAATFDFHKTRPITNGPAMTDSIHALIAARLGRATEAEKDFRDSYKPFVRGPFVLFSEKRSLDRCVFTTGAGGVLQSVIYGFGGLDFAEKSGVISSPVALPPSWKKLTITGIQRGGKRYTLTVTPQGRTLK